MDRGFVFQMINSYMDNFAPGDARTLHDFKFTFLQIICSHEHYISFNLPMMPSRIPSKGIKIIKHFLFLKLINLIQYFYA